MSSAPPDTLDNFKATVARRGPGARALWGMVALAYALRHPQRLASLVLSASSAGFGRARYAMRHEGPQRPAEGRTRDMLLRILDRYRGQIPFRDIGAKTYGLSAINDALAMAESMAIPKALVDPWR